jgi:hypothetical protein
MSNIPIDCRRERTNNASSLGAEHMDKPRITEHEAAEKFAELIVTVVLVRWNSIADLVGHELPIDDEKAQRWIAAEFGCAIAAMQMPALDKLFPPSNAKTLRYSAMSLVTDGNQCLHDSYKEYANAWNPDRDVKALLFAIADALAARLRITSVRVGEQVLQRKLFKLDFMKEPYTGDDPLLKGLNPLFLMALSEVLVAPNIWAEIAHEHQVVLESFEEPDAAAYRMLKGQVTSTLANAAPTAFSRMEEQGVLEAIVTKRALRIWPSVERRVESGMALPEALFDLASDLYPPEAEFLPEGEAW